MFCLPKTAWPPTSRAQRAGVDLDLGLDLGLDLERRHGHAGPRAGAATPAAADDHHGRVVT